MSIQIRHLRLVGTGRSYELSFLEEGEPEDVDRSPPLSRTEEPESAPATPKPRAVRPLSVIAGQISTGKTSILEFIAYCLGASGHPRHYEIERRVRAALLEVDLAGETVVIERPLFSSEGAATVHRCGLADLRHSHTIERRAISPPGSPSSLSTLLLEATGLAGIRLKEAPTQPESKTDPLSFRDLMWLCFLPNQRLDNKQLLQEGHHVRALKLRQVIEVVFEVYDDQLAAMGDQLQAMEEERADLEKEIMALDTFLRENEVPGRLELDARGAEAKASLQAVTGRLDDLSSRMRAESDYARKARAEFSGRRQASGEAAARLRDRETLLRRLLPLRGQYAEDERKLIFFEEAGQLFDPLRVRVCPACMQELQEPQEVEPGGSCSLCRQEIPAEVTPIDIAAERTAVRARLRAIERYIEEVESDLASAEQAYREALEAETAAQRRLDSEVAQTLSPFLAQRDDLLEQREELRRVQVEVDQAVRWHEGLDRRRTDHSRLETRIAELRERINQLRANRPDRNAVVGQLSERFDEILRSFGFPKLDSPKGPYLDESFAPYVRGNRYNEIGSTGAMTLIALAWQLTVFERAVELGQPHPGFLLIDSPQKNLIAQTEGEHDEFTDPVIVERVWEHLLTWSRAMGSAAQLIVVDNQPPPNVDDNEIVVRYSGNRDEPPYGLIDDETG